MGPTRRSLGLLLVVLALAGAQARAADPAWAKWKDLLNMLPEADPLNAARVVRGRELVDMEIQRIERATGKHVNFDRYEVEIKKLPDGMSADELFQRVRRNLNDYFDHTASTLEAYTTGDGQDWRNSANAPLGSVFIFKIPVGHGIPLLHEQAGVVTSLSESRKWIFTPVTIGWFCPGAHPVSGNREFGLTTASDGGYTLYIRAADRVLASCVPGEKTVFAGADRLWRSWQRKVVADVNTHGGRARALPPSIPERPTWEAVVKSGLFTRGSGS